MVTPYHLIKPLVAVVLFILVQPCTAQVNNDSIVTDTTAFKIDSIHDFHRKKGDILNYLLVDNFNNSALAGSLKSYQAQATYGNNLPGSPNNFHYGQVMLDMFFGNKQGRHGLAYRMSIGHAGFSNSIKQRIDYSFQFLNKNNYSIRAGVGVGFTMDQYLPQNLLFGDKIDYHYGFIFLTQELYATDPNINTSAFKVSRLQLNAGAQVRLYDGYLNFYYSNNPFVNTPSYGNGNGKYHVFGLSSLYNVNFKILQMVPHIQFNYFDPNLYLIEGGVLLANSTTKGGGGGITYNSNNILGISGLFAWNDFLHITAKVQLPMTDIRMSYPVSNFQLTLSYKVNDIGKYE